MAFKHLLYDIQDGVALVTFNRPDAMNALSAEVMQEFGVLLDEIRMNSDVAVAVLTGAGEKAFIAGADIKEMIALNSLEARNFSALGQEVILKIEDMPIPIIAAVNGFCLGGGCEIAMGCDFIYASEKAKFGQPEINLAIIPGFGGTQRLPRLVGKNMAKELCLTGEILSAAQAQSIGLVNKVFPHEQLMEETMKTARGIAGKSRLAVRAIKQTIDRGMEADLRTGLLLETQGFGALRNGMDSQEGLTAFAEKRKPVFKGNYNK